MSSTSHEERRVAGEGLEPPGARPPSRREVEEALLRHVMGWELVDDPDASEACPRAFWSASEGCYRVVRRPGADAVRFSPTRSFRDALEVRAATAEALCCTRLCMPVEPGNVRVVADLGEREVVAEGRSLPWCLALALYGAAVMETP